MLSVGAGIILRKQSLSARLGVKQMLGVADVLVKKQNQSAKIGVKLLLGGADVILKRQNLSARIGVKLLLSARIGVCAEAILTSKTCQPRLG